jgi:NhaA family Na+:H+ antiporter
MRLTRIFNDFFESEKAGGALLIGCTLLSILLANSPFADSYQHFWTLSVAHEPFSFWINEGLMTIFFLLIGLELERELYAGELSSLKNALLPAIAALGGMVLPAGIFLLFNYGTPAHSGAGIPTATDIAFAIGILSLLGSRVPGSLKVFLTAIAVIDDLGAILVIAVFYTSGIIWSELALALGIFALLLALNRLGVKNLLVYLAGGVAMWYCMLHSGVHATITGVLLAFAIPFDKDSKEAPSDILQQWLHRPVAFVILPLFALVNTAITIPPDWLHGLSSHSSIGIIAGQLLGKSIGIFSFSYIAVKLGICSLPGDIKWREVLGIGLLGGIGFTMSIFITLLAYTDAALIDGSKIATLVGSMLSGIAGLVWLNFVLTKKAAE